MTFALLNCTCLISHSKFFTDQRCLANCYNEVLETLKFLKPSNNKHYQNDDEDLAPEQNDYKNLIEAVAEGDDRLNENYKLWKVYAV